MIVLHKKQVLITLGIVAVSLITTSMLRNENNSNLTALQSEKSGEFLHSTVQTVALPVSNKTIVIDAGHGVPDERCSK